MKMTISAPLRLCVESVACGLCALAILPPALRANPLSEGGYGNMMETCFTDDGQLECIRVGDAVFATGGGNLWEAEFVDAASIPGGSGAQPPSLAEDGWGDGTATPQRQMDNGKAGINNQSSANLSPAPEIVTVAANDATSFERTETDESITLIWRGIALGNEPDVLDATIRIAKNADGSQSWTLSFDNRSPAFLLLRTRFLRLNRVTRDGEGDALLPGADYGATLYKKRSAQPTPIWAHYMGYSPPVAAFFIGDDGLYYAAEDPEARPKCLVERDEQSIHFDCCPELGASGPGFAVTLAPLKGDWWEAARRYRAFALRQAWASKGPIKDNPSYPRRICEIPLWINIHGHSDVASNVLTRARQIFPEFTTGLHWHLWQQSGHDINYPEYFPAQPRVKETIEYCHSIGQEPMPYTNGRLWTVLTAGYLLAEPYSVRKIDGTRLWESYGTKMNPNKPPLAVMCPWTAQWRRVVQTFTHRVLDELGATSIFIDQIAAAPARPCYDPTHGHPVGGGNWWRKGYAQILEPVLREWHERGAFVTTEGAGEAYLDLVDGFLQVVERKPEDVPFWSVVYSGYTTYFCTPEHVEDDTQSFRYQQCREMLWGHPMGWFDRNILDKPDKCEILRALCAFRQANLDALAYGNLLDELRPVTPLETVPFTWHPRFYWRKDATDAHGEASAVIGNWWRTADGEVVLLAANLTDKEQTVTCCRPLAVGGGMTASGQQQDTFTLTLAPHELRRISSVQ